jgi:hypothetical protein
VFGDNIVHVNFICRYVCVPVEHLLKLLCLSISRHATTREWLNGFSWNVLLRGFKKITSTFQFGQNQMTRPLYMNIYMHFCTLKWLSRNPCMRIPQPGNSSGFNKGQRSNFGEDAILVTLRVYFLSCSTYRNPKHNSTPFLSLFLFSQIRQLHTYTSLKIIFLAEHCSFFYSFQYRIDPYHSIQLAVSRCVAMSHNSTLAKSFKCHS